MGKAKKRSGPKGMKKDANRRGRRKVSILTQEKIDYVDWKDANLLRRFMSERAKIRARRVTGNDTKQQKLIADAIKIAREMALVPYANRVTTQRSNRDRGERRSRADGPAPRPISPPPGGDDGKIDEVEESDATSIEGVTIGGEAAMAGDAVIEEAGA